jgi:putative spermidine/putrescine transport system permease protein
MTSLKWNVAALITLVVIYIFIFAPAIVIVVDSLNSASSFPAPFESFTMRWYAAILNHPEFVNGFRVSVFIAAAAAIVSSLIGILAAYALVRYRVPGKDAIATFFLGPLLVPQIVIGLAILQIVSLVGFEIGMPGLFAAHTVYVFPFALRLAMTSLARFDFALEDAARSLGAGRWQTFRHVTLPLVRPGLISGLVFAFILSFVNLPTSLFLTSPATATLPIVMFSYMEASLDPMIAAVASFVLISAFVATIVVERVFQIRLLS